MEMKNDEGEVKWNEDEVRMERERDFFLENIECQVSLIFTPYFLYKTANLRLVFRLIHILFIYLFFFSIQKETKIRLMEEKNSSPLASLQNFLEIF